MAFRVVADPPRNVVQLGERQSFTLQATGGIAELGPITRIDWDCVNDPERGHSVFKGPMGGRETRWSDAQWTTPGNHWIIAWIRIGGRVEQASLLVYVVDPASVPAPAPENATTLARQMRIVADPPLRTVSPEQRMSFRLELTTGDTAFRERIRVKWYCLNDLSGSPERSWWRSHRFGGTGWAWRNAQWEISGRHRIVCIVDCDGVRIDLEYAVSVISLDAMGALAPAMGDAALPEIVDRQRDAEMQAIRKIEAKKPAPPEKEAEYQERMRKREEYAVKLRELLDSSRGKERFPIRAQYYSPHNASPESEAEPWVALNVFLFESEPSCWTLVDWTNPVGERTHGVYDGWALNRNRSPQEALSGWDWHNRYPEGLIRYEWDADHTGRPVRTESRRIVPGAVTLSGQLETDGSALADDVSRVFDYIAIAAGVVAGVALLVAPVPGSSLVSAAIWASIFSSTAAATINIASRADRGASNLRDDSFDALTIAASLLGAGAMARTGAAMAAMTRGAVVTSRSLSITRSVLFASFGADAIQGILIAESGVRSIDKVLEDPNLAPDERLAEVVRLVGQLAAQGALLAVNLRGTRLDAAALSQPNQHLPQEQLPAEMLERLKDPKGGLVDLDAPRRAEGTTAQETHTTKVQTSPARVLRRLALDDDAARALARSAERREFERVIRTMRKPQRGPVLSTIVDKRTGDVFHGRNQKGVPPDLDELLVERLRRYHAAVKRGEIVPRKFENGDPVHGLAGSHSEVWALNEALKARRSKGLPVSEELLDEFVLTNVRLKDYNGGSGNKGGKMGEPIVRCPNCHPLTLGVDSMVD